MYIVVICFRTQALKFQVLIKIDTIVAILSALVEQFVKLRFYFCIALKSYLPNQAATSIYSEVRGLTLDSVTESIKKAQNPGIQLTFIKLLQSAIYNIQIMYGQKLKCKK